MIARLVALALSVLVAVVSAGCTDGQRVSAPGAVVDLGARALAGGASHMCAVLAEDHGVACWGEDTYGQLGDGRPSRPRREPVRVAGLTGIRAVTAGYEHTCALEAVGTVTCWGLNLSGQLGDGADGNIRPVPATVARLSDVTGLAAGQHHTCAQLETGRVNCWGENAVGELGDGTTENRREPVPVPGLGQVSRLAAGGHHTCAVADARLHCWGFNAFGQVGDGTRDDRDRATVVPGLEGVTGVAAGEDFTCAVLRSGSVQCWGGNEFGQLGDDTRTDRLRPVQVEGLGRTTALAAHGGHVCALERDGQVLCWGAGSDGQNGDGSRADRGEPHRIDLDAAAIEVSATDRGACARTARGEVICWGRGTPSGAGP